MENKLLALHILLATPAALVQLNSEFCNASNHVEAHKESY